MDRAVRKYLHTQAAIGFASNLILNGVIAWLVNRSKSGLTLAEIAVDLAITVLVLVFLVSLLTTAGTRKAVLAGTAPRVAWQRADHRLLRWLPYASGLRALLLAVVLAVVLVPAICGLCRLSGVDSVATGPYIVFKSLFAGLLGGGVAWVSALAALGEPAAHAARSGWR
jgi:hypothetical protein